MDMNHIYPYLFRFQGHSFIPKTTYFRYFTFFDNFFEQKIFSQSQRHNLTLKIQKEILVYFLS